MPAQDSYLEAQWERCKNVSATIELRSTEPERVIKAI
jgi:hypothetical protein